MSLLVENNCADRLTSALDSAKKCGASGAKAGCVAAESIYAKFEAGRLKDTGGDQGFAVTVDAVVNGRRGQASCRDIVDLDKVVKRAVGLAGIGSVAHFSAWPAPAAMQRVAMHSQRTAELPRERLISACGEISELLKQYDPDLFISCGAGRSSSQGVLMTSGGVCHKSARTGWSLSAEIQRTRGTDMVFAWDGRGWSDLNEYFDPKAIAGRIIEQLRRAETTVEPPTGKVKAFLEPEALMAFCWALMMGINGRAVAKGESPLADKIGKQVIAPCFTITDDPHRDFCGGAAEIDDDGIPTKRQAVVEGGVLERFLYDLDTAGLAKAAPTGNRGCRMYNPVMRGGARSSADIVKGIDDGLYLTANMIGFGQSNLMNGDFSCNIGLGYRIRNGEIVGRVKDTMIAGNLHEIMRGNVELSSDFNYEGNIPYAVVEGVTSSARK